MKSLVSLLQYPKDAQTVIAVDVRDEDQFGRQEEAGDGMLGVSEMVHNLVVGSFGAVHEDSVAVVEEVDGGGIALFGRLCRNSAQKEYLGIATNLFNWLHDIFIHPSVQFLK